MKISYKAINLKYLSQSEMKIFNDLMDYTVYQSFQIILSIPIKIHLHDSFTDNPSIRIYVNKIENIQNYLELLTS